MIINSLFSIAATFGFGIIFNIKGKKLISASIGGGLGWFIYSFALSFNHSDLISLFLASLGLSIYSEVMARILKTPVTSIIVPAIIPLVPGSLMYYTMYEAITGNFKSSLETGFNALASAGSLALGIILISTITRQIMVFVSKRTS
ncbi:MAG: threonine/serine exporter [Clostridiales bacterium]|nr:threonine/serine exporter [Clostridiales bacterium]